MSRSDLGTSRLAGRAGKRTVRPSDRRIGPVRKMSPGDTDPMSRMAAVVGLPTCSHLSGKGRPCTRAAGHSEGLEHSDRPGLAATHPSSDHVHADATHTVREVWAS